MAREGPVAILPPRTASPSVPASSGVCLPLTWAARTSDTKEADGEDSEGSCARLV